jgi:hypothetical protein
LSGMTIDTTAIYFGGPASLTVDGPQVGATMSAPKITVQVTQVAPEPIGAGGPVAGLIWNSKIKATCEFDVLEITAAKLAWALPGSSSVVGDGTAALSGDAFATTLDGAAAIGDTLLSVAGTASPLAVGQYLKIGTGTGAETRKVKAIVTGAAIEVTEALQKAHDSGADVVRLVDAGTTVTTWHTGRVPSTAFKDVVLDGEGVDGRHMLFTLTDAISDGQLSMEFGDTAPGGVHVIMSGTYAGTDPTLAPFTLEVGVPAA